MLNESFFKVLKIPHYAGQSILVVQLPRTSGLQVEDIAQMVYTVEAPAHKRPKVGAYQSRYPETTHYV
jgi:hypothetical protein